MAKKLWNIPRKLEGERVIATEPLETSRAASRARPLVEKTELTEHIGDLTRLWADGPAQPPSARVGWAIVYFCGAFGGGSLSETIITLDGVK